MQPLIVGMDTAAARRIRFHGLAGDELAVRQGEGLLWLRPAGRIAPNAEDVRRQRLAFAYSAEPHADISLSLEFGLFAPELVQRVAREASRITTAAMDRQWRPTIACLGPVPDAGAATTAETHLPGPMVVAARRSVHPSYILDRLIVRQRALVIEEIEAMLYGGVSENAGLLSA